jgi:glutathionyl-hydroquinone reductase
MRMFYEAFDGLVPEQLREKSKGDQAFRPPHLVQQIDAMNEWVYEMINNGVYKTGFATSQEVYEEHVYAVFHALDRLEQHLSSPANSPYLFGEHITDADLRLFPTILRFDVVYYNIFNCNLKMIRHDYPRVHDWMRRLYWHENPAFRLTTRFDMIKGAYAKTMNQYVDLVRRSLCARLTKPFSGITPVGPYPNVLPFNGMVDPVKDEAEEHRRWMKLWSYEA